MTIYTAAQVLEDTASYAGLLLTPADSSGNFTKALFWPSRGKIPFLKGLEYLGHFYICCIYIFKRNTYIYVYI